MPQLEMQDVVCLIDNREKDPFDLSPMKTESACLFTGDYSLKHFEHYCSVEKKGRSEFLACVGKDRPRFEKQLLRLRGIPVSCVVIEASWEDLYSGNWSNRLTINHVVGSVTGWLAAGHNLVLAGDRAQAEDVTKRILFHVARRQWRQARPMVEQVCRQLK